MCINLKHNAVLVITTVFLSTNSISQTNLLSRLGISKITNQSTSSNTRSIKLQAHSVILNDKRINLNNDSFQITRINSSSYSISYQTESSNVLTARYNGQILTFQFNEETREFTEETMLTPEGEIAHIIMFKLLDEISNNFDTPELFYEEIISTDKVCYPTTISLGGGRSQADARCVDKARTYLASHSDCKQQGSCDVSCIFDNHACFGTAFFQCTGKTCGSDPDYSCWSCEFPWI